MTGKGNVYKGQYYKGKAQGKGTYKWQNGEIYTGEWHQGLRNGKGKWVGIHGDSYEGDWVNGKVSISISFILSRLKGTEFMSGKTVSESVSDIKFTGDKYEGEWYKSYKHGYGTDTFINGDKYMGEYSYGKF